MIRSAALAMLLGAALAIGACGGESDEEKAVAQVCDARADVKEQVDALRGLTVTTVTREKVESSVDAIRNGLSDIRDAQSDLGEQRRAEIKAANDAFTSQLESITANLGENLSLQNAATQAQAALAQLEAAYRASLERIDC